MHLEGRPIIWTQGRKNRERDLSTGWFMPSLTSATVLVGPYQSQESGSPLGFSRWLTGTPKLGLHHLLPSRRLHQKHRSQHFQQHSGDVASRHGLALLRHHTPAAELLLLLKFLYDFKEGYTCCITRAHALSDQVKSKAFGRVIHYTGSGQ